MTGSPSFHLAWPEPGSVTLGSAELRTWYGTSGSWLRANMATTLDGSVTGADGRSGSINNPADHVIFAILRSWAEAIVVGAGTARAEGYRPTDRPIVVVSHRGHLPETLAESEAGRVFLVAPRNAPGLTASVARLGADQVITLGDDDVPLNELRPILAERGWRRLLCEGGPTLLHALVQQGQVDEITATVVPRLAAGLGPRLLHGPALDVPLELTGLLAASDGTLFGRWLLHGLR